MLFTADARELLVDVRNWPNAQIRQHSHKRVAIFRDTRNGVPSDFGSEKLATTLPSAARARPASALALHFSTRSAAPRGTTMTLRRVGCLMFCLRPLRRLRQNIQPSGYAGVVAHPVLLQSRHLKLFLLFFKTPFFSTNTSF
jgi:hypothetical protein